MKMFSRSILAAAFSAALAPALLAELSGVNLGPVAGNRPLKADIRSPHFLPSDSGSGSGLWVAPSDVNGAAVAKLYDADGIHRYSLRSTLVYFVPSGEGGVQGGFFGTLLSSKNGKLSRVADVTGTWVHRIDGSGYFSAAVVTSTPSGPTITIGHMAGSMAAANPSSALSGSGPHMGPFDDDPSKPAGFARLSMNWTISE